MEMVWNNILNWKEKKLKGNKLSKKNNEASSKSFENDINILRTELNTSYDKISR